jgi:hypothetical protein
MSSLRVENTTLRRELDEVRLLLEPLQLREEQLRRREEEERRIDPKCWKGYHKAGTKLKSGVRVNNCVKN